MKKHLFFAALLALAVALGAAGGRAALAVWSNVEADHIDGDYATQRAAAGQRVVLLGTQWCDYCRQARDYLNARGVPFADLDVETSEPAEAMHVQLGAPGVPVLLIGDRQIRGFRPQAIADALAALRDGGG